VDLFEWDETVAYHEEAQYVGTIELQEEAGIQMETLPNHIGSIRIFLKRKKLRCCHLEGPSTTPSTLKKGPNAVGSDLPNVLTPVDRTGQIPQNNGRRKDR